MQRQSLTFNPQIAALAKPSDENWGTALGKGMMQLGSVMNNAHDRGRKEMFEDKQENRASEAHSWAGETHAQNMTKGAQQISFNEQMNPLKIKAKQLSNDRTSQIINQSAELHPLAVIAKKLNINKMQQDIDFNAQMNPLKIKAKQLGNDRTSQIINQSAELHPLSVKLRTKEIENYGKTADQKEYEAEKKDPGYVAYKYQKAQRDTVNAQKKEEELLKKSLLQDIRKIKDPIARKKAYKVWKSGADIDTINETIGAVAQTAALTLDHKKAREKNAEKVADAKSAFDVFDRLIDNYDDKYIGPFDNNIAGITGKFNATTNPKEQAYRTDLGRLTLIAKKMDNMGASFTKSEQEMMKKAMPDPSMSESTYKAQLATYAETMRDLVKNKLKALDRANYDTGELRSFLTKMDATVAKAKRFAGISSNSNANKAQTKQSLYSKSKPTEKQIVSRGTYKGRAVVKYSDGSIEYVK